MHLSSPSRRLRRVLVAVALSGAGVAGAAVVVVPTAGAAVSSGQITTAKTDYVRGELAKFTLTIPTAPKTAKATGTATLTVDGTDTDTTASVVNGKAILSTRTIAVGTHDVTARYSGDANYVGGAPLPVTVTVAQGATTTTIASRTEPVPSGKAAVLSTLSKRVSPASGGTLAGPVDYTATPTAGRPVRETVAAGATGSSQWRPKLADGTWTITATYAGNADFAGSDAAPLTIQVGAPAESTVDQQQLDSTFNYVGIVFPGSFTRGLYQTFTAGRTGVLDKVSLLLTTDNVAPTSVTISITTATPGVTPEYSKPTATVLGSTTWAWAPTGGIVDIPLTVPANVVAGTEYAITVESNQDAFNAFLLGSNIDGGYGGGTAGALDNGSTYNDDFPDIVFKTWVR